MKATRKLIPAIALLLVSAVLLSTASYAWFTTNKIVTASMNVSVTAPQNLQISTNATDWFNAVDLKDADVTHLTPVSSMDGKTFVLVKGLQLANDRALIADDLANIGEGKALGGSISTVSGPSAEISGSAKEYYYLVKEFQLRATKAVTAGDLVLDLDITGADGTQKAYEPAMRVAIFALDAIGGNIIDTVYMSDGSCNAIVPKDSGYDISADTAYTPVEYEEALEAAQIVYYRVVIWVEGNDAACISANVDAAPAVNVTLTFEIDET